MKWISLKDNPPTTEDEFLIWPQNKYAGISAMFWPYSDLRGKEKNKFFIESEYEEISIIEVTHYMVVPEMIIDEGME